MRQPRIGLVLGGGGIQGAAWLEGALAALAAETGWNPGDADVLIGTSAGAWTAANLAAGVPPWLLATLTSGEALDGLGPVPPGFDRADMRRRSGRPSRRIPGSPPLFRRAVLPPWPLSAAHAFAGLAPRGHRASGVDGLIRAVLPTGWPERDLRCVACDYRTGDRVPLTRDTPGATDAATAVAASCAIPGYFAPVPIAGAEYVDGGMHSVSNLDLAAHLGLDLVICLNPMSAAGLPRPRRPVDAAWRLLRSATGRRLAQEAATVRAAGTEVLLIQPTAADLDVLGSNWLRATRHREVIALCRETVGKQLRDARVNLAQLPRSPEHLVRRPDGPATDWPELVLPAAWSASLTRR